MGEKPISTLPPVQGSRETWKRTRQGTSAPAFETSACFGVDSEERICFWSNEAEKKFGLPASAALGKRGEDILGPRDLAETAWCARGVGAARLFVNEDGTSQDFVLLEPGPGGALRFAPLTAYFAACARFPEGLVLHRLVPRGKEAVAGTPARGDLADASCLAQPEDRQRIASLSPRERQTLRYLTAGLSTADIAREMKISRVTVKNHIQHLLKKLNLHSKSAAIVVAYRSGLGTENGS